MSEIEIIPAILTDNPSELRDLMGKAEGVVKRIHIDIIDGVFVSNKTVDPSAFNNFDTTMLLDFHLMVNKPVNWLEKCVVAGGSRVIAQVEMMDSTEEFIKKAQELGISPGLAIDINTPVESIERRLLTDVDVVLAMSVPAGFGGQEFHDSAIGKIKKLANLRANDNTPFKIACDGGIKSSIIKQLRNSRADEIIIGNRIFEGDLAANIAEFKNAS
jgi:ribulose-phosphate 3-epimerase